VINIFIGIRLEKAATSSTAYYIFIVYEVFQVAMIIVLEVLRIKENMANIGVSCKFNYSLIYQEEFADTKRGNQNQ